MLTVLPSESLQAKFLSVLPRIREHGRIFFRHVRRRDKKEDLVTEMVALAWKWFVRLAQRGKDATQFASVLASYAARAILNGRRLCGAEGPNDALSPRAQRRHGFRVATLLPGSHLIGNAFDEALQDNMQTPVPDQVSFRCDFPRWRASRCDRDRRVIDQLMVGERTLDVARRFGVSEARISQLRAEFRDDWERFGGEDVAVATTDDRSLAAA